MSEAAEIILAIYVCLTVCTGLFAGAAVLQGNQREQKIAARVVLFCWAWPILMVWPIYRGVEHLWVTADISRGDRR